MTTRQQERIKIATWLAMGAAFFGMATWAHAKLLVPLIVSEVSTVVETGITKHASRLHVGALDVKDLGAVLARLDALDGRLERIERQLTRN